MTRGGWLSGALLSLGLAAVLLWPAVATVAVAIRGGAEPGAGLLSPVPSGVESGGVRRPLGLAVETVRLVLATESIALAVGLPLAFLLFRTDVAGRGWMLGMLAVSAFVPLPLHASAWLGAFGNAGRTQALGLGMLPVLSGWPGAAVVHAMACLPWVVLLAGVGFLTVEPELEEAARLDLAGWRVAIAVTLRRSLGAVGGAALAVAVLTAGDMTVTDLLQVRTYAEEAYLQYNLGNGPAAAAAVAVPPLVVLGGLVALGAWMLLNAEPARLGSMRLHAVPWPVGAWRLPVGAVVGLFVAVAIGLPVESLLWRAGRVGGVAATGQPPAWSLAGLAGTLRLSWSDSSGPLAQSLGWAAVSATAALALAWALAWKGRKPGVWRGVAAGSVALALATPGPVAGMALVYAYRDLPPVYDSAAMIVLAGVLRTFPHALAVLWPSIRTLPPVLLDSAEVDGLRPAGVVVRVALPLTRAATLAAWCVAFTLALAELPATNLVAPPGTTPLSVVIWGLLHTGVESHTAGVVLVMLAAVVLAGSAATYCLWRLKGSEPT